MFECTHWAKWRIKKWIAGALRTWESWGDLGLSAWVEESEDGKASVDLVRVFISHIDLR